MRRHSTGVTGTPAAAKGRSLTNSSVKQDAIAIERLTSAVTVAAGLPMRTSAVVTRIGGSNTEITVHWIVEIGCFSIGTCWAEVRLCA